MSNTCTELLQTECYKSCESIEAFFEGLMPTQKRVMKLLTCNPENAAQMAPIGYLKQYIYSMDPSNSHCFGDSAPVLIPCALIN